MRYDTIETRFEIGPEFMMCLSEIHACEANPARAVIALSSRI